jgi:hypothetical protein
MSTMSGSGKANEFTFQNDMIKQLVANGWLLGKPENWPYTLKTCWALYKRLRTSNGKNLQSCTQIMQSKSF